MYASMNKRCNKGFTMPEVLVAATISLLIALSTWSIYTMGAVWWAKFMPRIEAQRVVRIAVKTIVYGLSDPNAGFDKISGVRYSRRNGIAWATDMPTLVSDSNVEQINYKLKNLDNQSFFMLKTEDPMKLYHNNTQSPMSGTTGLTGLFFQADSLKNMVTVTATVEKDVCAVGQSPYHVKAELTQTVFLKNIR